MYGRTQSQRLGAVPIALLPLPLPTLHPLHHERFRNPQFVPQRGKGYHKGGGGLKRLQGPNLFVLLHVRSCKSIHAGPFVGNLW